MLSKHELRRTWLEVRQVPASQTSELGVGDTHQLCVCFACFDVSDYFVT